MPIAIEDIFFQVTSRLTGGFVTDFGTAITGGILLLIIMAGLDLLKEFFNVLVSNRTAERNFTKARDYMGLRDSSYAGSAEYEYYDALYNAHMKKSVSLSASTGKSFSHDVEIVHGGQWNPFYEDDAEQDDGEGISDEDHEIEFDGDIGPPSLYSKYISRKYL
jgi:hypothetical protein